MVERTQSTNTTNPLRSGEGDAGSTDFPPLASIIAPSVQDDSGSDRRCLITSTWQTNWVCVGFGMYLTSVGLTVSHPPQAGGVLRQLPVGAEGTWE